MLVQLICMPKVDSHPPGSFCWLDLATTNPSAARRFYTQLFGWQAENSPMPGDAPGVYTTLYKRGAMVGGMYEHNPAMKAIGIPSHWESYIAVDDVDAAAGKAEQLGGKIKAPSFEIPGVGRMVALEDPSGAGFNLYKPAGDSILQLVKEPGAYGWSELYTSDPGAAVEFYGGLLGWRVKQTTSADGHPYYELSPVDGRAVAGMMKIRPEWGPIAPNWSVYFQVADLDASVAKVRSLGGALDMPAMKAEGVGRFAMVSDPADASFFMTQMAHTGG